MTLKNAPNPTVLPSLTSLTIGSILTTNTISNASALTTLTVNGARPAPVVLGNLRGVIASTTSDNAMPIASTISKYMVTGIFITNASAALGSIMTAGFFSASAAGGTKFIASTQTYSLLSSATQLMQPALSSASTQTFSGANVWMNINAGASVAATFDIYVQGVDLT